MRILQVVAVALTPIAFTAVLGWFLLEGYVGFGGGEKDILLLVPFVLWSLAFAVACLVLRARGRALLSSAARSAGYATLVVALLWAGFAGVALFLLG